MTPLFSDSSQASKRRCCCRGVQNCSDATAKWHFYLVRRRRNARASENYCAVDLICGVLSTVGNSVKSRWRCRVTTHHHHSVDRRVEENGLPDLRARDPNLHATDGDPAVNLCRNYLRLQASVDLLKHARRWA